MEASFCFFVSLIFFDYICFFFHVFCTVSDFFEFLKFASFLIFPFPFFPVFFFDCVSSHFLFFKVYIRAGQK